MALNIGEKRLLRIEFRAKRSKKDGKSKVGYFSNLQKLTGRRTRKVVAINLAIFPPERSHQLERFGIGEKKK